MVENFVRLESVLVLNVKYVNHVFQKELNLLPTRDLSSFKIPIQNFYLEKKCHREETKKLHNDSIEQYKIEERSFMNHSVKRSILS